LDQRRGVQYQAGLLVRQLQSSEAARFVVDQRQQLGGGVQVALPMASRMRVTSLMPAGLPRERQRGFRGNVGRRARVGHLARGRKAQKRNLLWYL
jgi:hypothetical protein